MARPRRSKRAFPRTKPRPSERNSPTPALLSKSSKRSFAATAAGFAPRGRLGVHALEGLIGRFTRENSGCRPWGLVSIGRIRRLAGLNWGKTDDGGAPPV